MKKRIRKIWMYVTIPFKIIYYACLIYNVFKDQNFQTKYEDDL
jgi:hypothetical protein